MTDNDKENEYSSYSEEKSIETSEDAEPITMHTLLFHNIRTLLPHSRSPANSTRIRSSADQDSEHQPGDKEEQSRINFDNGIGSYGC